MRNYLRTAAPSTNHDHSQAAFAQILIGGQSALAVHTKLGRPVEQLLPSALAHADGERDAMNAVLVLAVAIFAFGGLATAFAWIEAQNRGPTRGNG